MNDLGTPPAFTLKDARQARLYERLSRLIGAGAGQFFRDACAVASGQLPLGAGSHLVAHALREVEGSIRQVLEPFEDGVPLPKNTHMAHERSIRKVCRGLGLTDTDRLIGAWLTIAGKDDPDALHKRAHRDDLREPRPLDQSFSLWVNRVLTVCDAVMERAEANYSVVFRALDSLLSKPAPGAGDVDWLVRRVPNTPLTHSYFLDRLEHSGWLAPLMPTGILTRVSQLDRNEEEGTVGFPPWPARAYLLRMAQTGDRVVQEQVLAALRSLPTIDNTRIHADVAEIAVALPPDLAREVVGYVDQGLREPYHLLLPHRAGPLIVYLANAGLLGEAERLTRTMFEVVPESSDKRARIADVSFHHELEPIADALVAADPWRAARLFADLLEVFIAARRGGGEDNRHSHSYMAWPSLGRGHRLSDSQDHLLSALLKAAVAAAERDPSRLTELVAMLEARTWLIFARVALYILTVAENPPAEIVDAWATNPAFLDELEVKAEYDALLNARFPDLSPAQQAEILSSVTAIPDRQEERASLERWFGRVVSDDEVDRALRRSRYDQMRRIVNHLSPTQQEECAVLQHEFGEEQGPLPRAEWDDRSPRNTDQLLALTDGELISYLREIKLDHQPFGPSMEGLGDALAGAASDAPRRISTIAPELRGLDPTLLSGLLRGLEAAVRKKEEVAWPEILVLCVWIAEQPREIPGRKTRYSDRDPGWVWTRRQVASLLLEGLNERARGPATAQRHELWSIVQILLTDADPVPSETDENNPVTTAMNSVRGQAIRAVMAYGLWVRRAEPETKTFDGMAEVKAALEAHLDPAIDSSSAVRAVYGELLGIPFHLDEQWLRRHLPSVFPSDPEQHGLRRAAWESYVRFRSPLVPLLAELTPEYRQAIHLERMETPASQKPNSAAKRLAEHIMIMAWQGNVPLMDRTGLVQEFFREATLSMRAYAIEFVGRAMSNTPGPVPADVLGRIQELWGWREEVLRSVPAESARAELAAFGWWVASRKLPPEWSLSRLLEVLQTGAEIDWEHQVLETLAESSTEFPLQAVECLDLIVQRDRDQWGLELSQEAVRTILVASVRSGDQASQRLARSVVSRLESRGIHGFGSSLG